MMTQQLAGFSLITAPLAAVDRRSLSQAWYSALHLASERGAPTAAATSASMLVAHPVHRDATDPAVTRAASRNVPIRTVQSREAKALREVVVERRTARSSLARSIERRFLNPLARVRRATFTIEGTTARVHIAMQTHGTDVRLVAICAPAVRATVARALQDARYALAQRGIVLALEGDRSC